MVLNLLLVDDDSQQRKIAKDAIDSFIKKTPYEIQIDEAHDFENGVKKLTEKSYDAAIVDLRLKKNDTSAQGNEVLKEIKSLRFPIRVVSGHVGDLDEQFREKTFFSDYYNRDDVDYDAIMSDFISIHQTGITNILNNKGRISEDMSKIFWTHISTILNDFIEYKKKAPDWDIEKALLRYVSSHISEYLELDSDSAFEPVHPIEFYISPPIKQKLFTGDIVKENNTNDYWIILTPACDLATDSKRSDPKAEYITICRVEDAVAVEKGVKSGEVGRLKTNSKDLKYHFLPKSKFFQGGYVNFQNIASVPVVRFGDNFKTVAVISGPFRKDIVSRFSNYYARQGQPTLLP